jgi:uncharacterized membrane protein
MTRYYLAGLASLLTMAVLDAVWLGWIAKSLYQNGVGHLMAPKPNFVVAVIFYLVFAAGLMVFAVAPNEAKPGLANTVISAALFGLVCYATYDLSNLATLKDWPVGLALLDMLWGSALSAVAATAGKLVLDRMNGGS